MGEIGSVAETKAGLQPLDVDEFRAHAHRMVDFIADYYRDIDRLPVRSQVQPGYLQKLIPDSAPEESEILEEILEDVRSKILPGVTNWQSPNFFAYFPANSSTAGFLGEMLSGALNVIGFSWVSSPAATELEIIVLDWLAQLLHLPSCFSFTGSGKKGGGVIQGSASESVLVAMLAARARAVAGMALKEGSSVAEASSKLVAYFSDQAHSSVQKAAMVAGIEHTRIIQAQASAHWSLDSADVAAAVKADKEKGLVPFFLNATIGTTSTTAVDPVSSLGDVAMEHGMWLHVDAAYAGTAMMLEEHAHHLNGVQKADSFIMNAHKWMLTNFDCSCLFVKDSTWLVNALSLSPEYLRNKATDAKLVVDYKDWQIPLGRRFRSLKIWMVLRLYGAAGVRRYVRSHIEMAQHFEQAVLADGRFEVVAPRTFSLVCFRVKPAAGDMDNGKTLNSTLLENLNSKGTMFFTHTVASGIYVLRLAIGATLTKMENVEAAWAAIQAEATSLLSQGPYTKES